MLVWGFFTGKIRLELRTFDQVKLIVCLSCLESVLQRKIKSSKNPYHITNMPPTIKIYKIFLLNIWTYLTTSTAPGRTLGSLPIIDILAVKEPSMLNTTVSVRGGRTVRYRSTAVWSPRTTICTEMKIHYKFYPSLSLTADAHLAPLVWELTFKYAALPESMEKEYNS